MSDISVDALARQSANLQRLESRLRPGDGTAATASPLQALGQHFRAVLNEAAASEARAGHLAQNYEAGLETDVATVMMARQKASLAFEATLQVRNKLLSAYKEIMSMPV